MPTCRDWTNERWSWARAHVRSSARSEPAGVVAAQRKDEPHNHKSEVLPSCSASRRPHLPEPKHFIEEELTACREKEKSQ